MFNSNPLAEANGIKKKNRNEFCWLKTTAMKKKKTEKKVVMENIYCRRFQPMDQESQ